VANVCINGTVPFILLMSLPYFFIVFDKSTGKIYKNIFKNQNY